MGRRYLSTLLVLFFQRLLIADDILEERLCERAQTSDRLAGFEERVVELEAAVSELQKRGAGSSKAGPGSTEAGRGGARDESS
jgi:hypothetical protein